MFAAQKQTAGSRERKSAKRSPERAHGSAQPMPAAPWASCACGGGCPRCRYKYPLQAKLEVSQPGDIYEEEANHAAERVMRMETPDVGGNRSAPSMAPIIQRRVSESAGGLTEAPPLVHEVLRSPGQPLDPSTRDFMEPRFGADFREVRVHTGADAAASARVMRAQAYTVGPDVVFAAGKFSPATAEGRALLAHELTHVRQDPRSAGGLTSDIVIGSSHDPAESEAAVTAAGALRGEIVRLGPWATAAVGGTRVLRRAEATGATLDSDLETLIDADVQRIIAILDEWHYSNANEQEVIDILTKWALAPAGPSRLTPLDRVFAKLTRRTTTVGVMGETVSYYSLIFNYFNRAQEVRELRDRHAPLFHGEAGIQEASILEQDWMETAGEFYGPIKEGFYDALIAGMRGTQAAALNRMRAMIANWPPAAKAVGEVVIAYIELNSDVLISFVLGIVGLVVGFASGIAKMVWGLLQFLWGILDLLRLWIQSHFSEARREELQERAEAIDEGIRQFFPALITLAEQWWDKFQKESPDRQSIMIGELTGEIEALLASMLAGGKVAGKLPKLEVAPARAFSVAGGGTLVRGGATTATVVAAGPPLVAGTLIGTTTLAVNQEAKSGSAPEQAPKKPAREPTGTGGGKGGGKGGGERVDQPASQKTREVLEDLEEVQGQRDWRSRKEEWAETLPVVRNTTPPGAVLPPPLDASPEIRVRWLSKRLQQHMDQAIKRLEVEGHTVRQLEISGDIPAPGRAHPQMAEMHRGQQIDMFMKDSVMQDPDLSAVLTASDYFREPDFIDAVSTVWHDATTRKDWIAHLKRYQETHGEGFGVFHKGKN